MSKIKRIRIKPRVRVTPVPGTSPGAQLPFEDNLPSRITVHSYNKTEYYSKKIKDVTELEKYLDEKKDLLHWIDVKGLGNNSLFNFIEHKLGIHKLVIEDILNSQRPKIDEYKHYLYLISRSIYINKDLEIENEQVSFILTKKILISFQENYIEYLNPVIERLKSGKGNIRTGGTSYILYALTDLIIDTYFSTLYRLGDELDTLEEFIYRKPDKTVVFDAHAIKRILVLIRRAAWPERDKLNDMMRSESSLITQETKTFLKDAYDHSMQIIDLVESYKDITTSIIDLNLSFVSNRMNEIMKVLTVISSIFIPLTFIAGVYGMNFAYKDPKTGRILEHNMPELYAENGYTYTVIVMAAIAIVQIIFFIRKGWLK